MSIDDKLEQLGLAIDNLREDCLAACSDPGVSEEELVELEQELQEIEAERRALLAGSRP